MEKNDIVLELAKLELSEARQYESQRERLVTLSIVVTGGLLTAFTLQTGIDQFKVSLAVFSIHALEQTLRLPVGPASA